MPSSTTPPIVIISCRVFQHWLEQLLPPGLDAPITYFDYGLHAVPKNLRQTIHQAIDSVEQPSLIVLGYGLCGKGLDQINAGRHFLLIPRTDDCIGIILGSYQAYRCEIEKEPGTYYLSKGWLEAGTNPLEQYRACLTKYGEETTAYLMDTQYSHYRRLMMVARDQAELEAYRPRAREVADYCARWGMCYEEIFGSDDYLRQLLDTALDLTRLSDDFILIPPGGTLTHAHFMREEA